MSVLFLLSTPCFSQHIEPFQNKQKPFSTIFIKVYPIWFINGVKLELATNLSQKLELNVRAQYFYKSFYFYGTKTRPAVFPYYQDADGYGLHFSLDYRFNPDLSLGLKFGYQEKASPFFKVDYENYDPRFELIERFVKQSHEDLIITAILRGRKTHKHVFFELNIEAGAFRKNLNEEVITTYDQEVYYRVYPESYWSYYIGLGFALGLVY